MKGVITAGSIVVATSVLLAGAWSRDAAPLIITGARVLDAVGGRYLDVAAVSVDHGRIASLLERMPSALPDTTRRIDLPGTTIVAGLGDMYGTTAPSASADADVYHALSLAYGVTCVRAVRSPLPWAASHRSRVESGEISAPRLTIGGPRLDRWPSMGFPTRMVADAAAAAREVAEQVRWRADWITAGPSISPDLARAIVRAARAARLRVSAEPGHTSAVEWARLGVDAIDRLGPLVRPTPDQDPSSTLRPDQTRRDPDAAVDEQWAQVSAADIATAATRLAAARVAMIPLLGSFGGGLDAESLKADPAVSALPPRWRDGLIGRAEAARRGGAARAARAARARALTVRRLVRAGVRVATGVDVHGTGHNVPGVGIHRELSLLVAAGLTPVEAIRAATVNGALLLGTPKTSGQVAPGFDADFVVVDGDPLRRVEDLRRIRLIVRRGEVLDRDALIALAGRTTSAR